MSAPSDRQKHRDVSPHEGDSWFSLEIDVNKSDPNLLIGLERWLELGLISQAQIDQIARQYLSCTLPVKKVVTVTPPQEVVVAQEKILAAAIVSPKLNIISQLWQGFIDEISIRWLLFLGIFLVVVSSGVLAASQWNNFPILGQYLILLVYTLAFWVIGFWSSQQENLRLTAQTLRAIAFLLVPINCWAISHFGLGNNLLEWLVLIVAVMVLTAMVYGLASQDLSSRNNGFTLVFLLLSGLHLVWGLIVEPVWVIYLGILVIIAVNYLDLKSAKNHHLVNLWFWLVAWSLLLVRAILINHDSLANYGLAIASCAELISTIYFNQEKNLTVEENQSESDNNQQLTNTLISNICQTITLIIFLATWSISILAGILIAELFFWQTVGISALGIHFFSQRLTLNWRKRDLTAIFLIGLQTLYLSKELIPDSLRNNALNLAVTISKTPYLPESVLSVTLFPYIILWVIVTSWLYRRQKSALANYTESLTLLLGIGLTYLSFFNPTWRSLNLLLSTATLGYVAWIRQPLRLRLIDLTHFLGLVTILSGMQTILPSMNKSIAASILVLLMVGEWLIYLRHTQSSSSTKQADFWAYLSQSCWYFGLILAGMSYLGFASLMINTYSFNPQTIYGGLIWLITPIMLTWLAKHTHKITQRRLATSLSCLGLIIAQLLFLTHPIPRLISLAIAMTLMFINCFHLRRTWVTVIHLGFGIGLIVSLLSSWISGWNWLLVGGVTILGLIQLQQYLQQTLDNPKFDYISQRTAHGILGVGVEVNNYKLIKKYIQAADYWAIALIILEIVMLSIPYGDLTAVNDHPQYLFGGLLLLLAVGWHYRTQPNKLTLYALAWLIELLAVAIVTLLGGAELAIAVTNIILGLLTWAIVQQQSSSKNPLERQINLTYISLGYTALAILWRLSSFNTYTGLITLSAALILLNTPQENRQLARLSNYLGFAGISLGIYELIIHKMQQSSGGSVADALTILALVAAGIAFAYRLAVWWYRQQQHQTIFNLSLQTVVLIAHIHWAISSIIKILAASIAIESTTPRLTPLSIATSFCLGAYAVIQGKDRDPQTSNAQNDWWVYVGLVEIFATLVYSRLIISKLSFFDPWRIIFTCTIALIIYQIPWHNFGWRVTPWQRVAVITPALMALVTAEDIAYFSLLVTAIFYLRIAYHQKNIRWSYLSLGFINWGVIRLVWQFNTEAIWLAGIASLSLLYIAQYDPYFAAQRQQRHRLRLVACSLLCVTALFEQDPGIIPTAIAFCLIFLGLGLRIRALLFSGTITLIFTAIYQLMNLVVAYSFLKWVVGLLAGILAIVVAAGFEKNRDRLQNQLQNYTQKLQNWQ